MNWAFLASGRGSNFEAVARAAHEGQLPATKIVALVCNRSDAGALQVADKFRIPSFVIESALFRTPTGKWNRAEYEQALEECLERIAPDAIALGGYMLLLGRRIIQRWNNRIVNIHPSYLPAFPGMHAQRQAIEAGAKWTGCTAHLVNEGLDSGPILFQEKIEIRPGETAEQLEARLLPLEHAVFTRAINAMSRKDFRVEGAKVVWA